MSENNDFSTMLHILLKNKKMFSSGSSIESGLDIPEIIIRDSSKVYFWVTNTKDHKLYISSESFLKLDLIFWYYSHPNKPKMTIKSLEDYENGTNIPDVQKKVNYMIRVLHNGESFFYHCEQNVLEKMLTSQINSKIDCIYYFKKDIKSPLNFFEVNFKSKNEEEYSYEINHLSAFKVNKITLDIWKEQRQKCLGLNNEIEKFYRIRNLAKKSNEILIEVSKKLLTFFKQKTKEKLYKGSFYFMIQNSKVWILDISKTKIWKDETNIDDLPSVSRYSDKIFESLQEGNKIIRNLGQKCFGNYCYYSKIFQNALIDEKDEMNNLYLMESDQNNYYEIEFKSIILDYIERFKTIQRIEEASGYTPLQINCFPDGLLLRFRKFYSVVDIKQSKLFKHLNYSNLYNKKKVCCFCNAMYSKLDNLRIQMSNKKVYPFEKDPNYIPNEIQKYKTDFGFLDRNQEKGKIKNKIKFSKEFYKELKKFDEKIKYQKPLDLPDDIYSEYERKRKFKRKKRNEIYMKSMGKDSQGVSIPKSLVMKRKINDTALRLHLGTGSDVKSYQYGNITTSSSIQLSQMQDKLRRLERVAKKNQRGKLGMSENDFLELIMCPYYGRGVRDRTYLNKYLKEKEELESIMLPKNERKDLNIKVSIDRLRFMKKNNIEKKSDRRLENKLRKKKIKDETEKKNREDELRLLEENNGLAESVINHMRGSNAKNEFKYKVSFINNENDSYTRFPKLREESDEMERSPRSNSRFETPSIKINYN